MRNCYLILAFMIIFLPRLVMVERFLFKYLINQVVNVTVVLFIAGQSIQGNIVVRGA